VIDALSRELEVSPMPVREAIRRLEAERWVTYQRNVGARVAPRDAESWAETIEVLALIEGYVTARAASHMTAADFTAMRTLCAQMEADVDALDVIAVTEHNEAFHRIVWERCPNGALRRRVVEAQERLTSLRSTIYFPLRTRGRASVEEHVELVAMLESGRTPDDIERFARAHRLRTIAARERQLRDV